MKTANITVLNSKHHGAVSVRVCETIDYNVHDINLTISNMMPLWAYFDGYINIMISLYNKADLPPNVFSSLEDSKYNTYMHNAIYSFHAAGFCL